MDLVAVAAVAENGVIGRDGDLPWHLPADKRAYRERIAAHPVILGRRTFTSMLDDLPGRYQIVLSRSPRSYEPPSAFHAGSREAAIAIARDLDDEVAYVIGGEEIYALFLPVLDELLISRVPGQFEGDTHFPTLDPAVWSMVKEAPREGYILERWRRR